MLRLLHRYYALFQSQPLRPRKSSAYRSALDCCPATRVNLANTGKRRIFFYLLSSIIPFESAAFGLHRYHERWQAGWWWNMGHVVRLETTSLDAKSTPRRPYNAALLERPGEKRFRYKQFQTDSCKIWRKYLSMLLTKLNSINLLIYYIIFYKIFLFVCVKPFK